MSDLAPPQSGTNLLACIKALTIRGVKNAQKQCLPSFINSNIAAGTLGKVSLCYACFDNDGNPADHVAPFGLTGNSLAGLTYSDADKTHACTWKAGQPLPAWFDDLTLRLV